MAALPVDASGVPFNASHIYATGNIAHDMLANAVAESSGRMLACQLHRMTDDPGMKDMLAFLVARDTMHQNQWMAAYEELGGPKAHPIPTNFPMEEELQEVSYQFFLTGTNDAPPYNGPAASGPSYDGRGTFKPENWTPKGAVPNLGPASPKAAVQDVQIKQ
jgi:Mn-containing catalase